MAAETGLALPYVVVDIAMFISHVCLIVFVALNTFKSGKNAADVAIVAAVPFSPVRSGEDGEVQAVVVPIHLIPIACVVAQRAIGGESGCGVIGVGIVVIRLMAGDTVGWRIGVTLIVAGNAVEWNMRAGEREGGLVVVKNGRFPRGLAVALGTVGGEVIGHVVGVGDCVVVFLVAVDTVGGRIIVTLIVASNAIQRGMRANQREVGLIVIEGGGFPGCVGMALGTVG